MLLTSERSPSGTFALLSLVIANLVPLVGVYFWGWSLTDLLMLYWLENAVVGLFTMLGILVVQPDGQAWWSSLGAKLFILPFFTIHYGMFWVGHGFFLSTFFGVRSPLFGGVGPSVVGGPSRFLGGPESMFFSSALNVWERLDILAWPLAFMFVSHGVSFVTNFLASGEYRKLNARQVMGRPYSRVVVLHVTIVLGGFLVMFLGQSLAVLVLFVLVKIIADVLALLREQRQAANPAPATAVAETVST